MCRCNVPFSEKECEQILQLNGFSPECVLMCSFRTIFCEQEYEHKLQLNGFSPECVLRCSFKVLLWQQENEQMRQMKGLVWVVMWSLEDRFEEDAKWHRVQLRALAFSQE